MIGDYLEPFTPLRRVDTPDGEGGRSAAWVEGEPLEAGVTQATASDTAAQGGPAAAHQPLLYWRRAAALRSGDLLRRESDGALFRLIGAPCAMPCPARPRLYRARVERVVRG